MSAAGTISSSSQADTGSWAFVPGDQAGGTVQNSQGATPVAQSDSPDSLDMAAPAEEAAQSREPVAQSDSPDSPDMAELLRSHSAQQAELLKQIVEHNQEQARCMQLLVQQSKRDYKRFCEMEKATHFLQRRQDAASGLQSDWVRHSRAAAEART